MEHVLARLQIYCVAANARHYLKLWNWFTYKTKPTIAYFRRHKAQPNHTVQLLYLYCQLEWNIHPEQLIRCFNFERPFTFKSDMYIE